MRFLFFTFPLLILQSCYLFEGTYTNLWQYENNYGMSLSIANDTSFFLVTYRDSIEIFKSRNQGRFWTKQHSYDGKWIYWSSLLSDDNMYIVMQNREDKSHIISRFSISKKTTSILSLPDSLYWGASFWRGKDKYLRILLRSKNNEKRSIYRINSSFDNILLERMIPDSSKNYVRIIDDSIVVYQSKKTNNVVISYPHKEEVFKALKDKHPWLYADGKVYLTADSDTTDHYIYTINLINNQIDTIPHYPFLSAVRYVNKDTIVTEMIARKYHRLYGVTKDYGQTWKGIDPHIVFVNCKTVYKGKIYIFENGNFRSYPL